VARSSDTTPKTLRCYEAAGLLPRLGPGRGGLYDDTVFARLRLILALRELGWSIARIRALLGKPGRAEVAGALVEAVKALGERIVRCQGLRTDLISARESLFECARCDRPDVACQDCAVSGRLGPIARTLLIDR
jgi:DNA-binding transcriptional MerR regulator